MRWNTNMGMTAGGNGNNRWNWEENAYKTWLNLWAEMWMGMKSWELVGMGLKLKKTFSLISNLNGAFFIVYVCAAITNINTDYCTDSVWWCVRFSHSDNSVVHSRQSTRLHRFLSCLRALQRTLSNRGSQRRIRDSLHVRSHQQLNRILRRRTSGTHLYICLCQLCVFARSDSK